MAVKRVEELHTERASEIAKFGKLSHTRVFIVQTDTNDSSFLAAQAAGVPKMGDFYVDGQSRVSSVSCKVRSGEPGFWTVTCKYNNDYGSKPEDIEETDPLSADQTESWGAEERSRVLTTSKNGYQRWRESVGGVSLGVGIGVTQIMNTAADRYDEPLTIPVVFPTLTIKRNESHFDAAVATKYNNALNSETWRDFEKGQARVRITAEQARQDEVDFWKVCYVFTFNDVGWEPAVLEAGLYQLVNSSRGITSKVPCTEKGDDSRVGTPARTPMPLDKDGEQIKPDDLPGKAVYTQWFAYDYEDFSELGLGD